MIQWLWLGFGVAIGVVIVLAALACAAIWFTRMVTKSERIIATAAAGMPDQLRQRSAALHAAAQNAERALHNGASAHQIVAGLYVTAAAEEQRAAAVARNVVQA